MLKYGKERNVKMALDKGGGVGYNFIQMQKEV
jgi:hypothetical protein